MTPAGLCAVPRGGGTAIGGGLGIGGLGIGGIADTAVAAGGDAEIATRDLQSAQTMNFAPAGTVASATRLSVPQAEQVASIIQG
jgi:hypothetical protein